MKGQTHRKGAEEGSDSVASDAAEELRKGLALMAQTTGFQHYLLAEIPRADRTTFDEAWIADDWPEELRSFYSGADLLFGSELVEAVRRTIKPAFLKGSGLEGSATGENRRRLDVLVRKFGFEVSFVFALHDIELKHHMFAFSGSRNPLSLVEEQEMVCMAIELLDRHAQRDHIADGPTERLTSREVECLRWSAAGKSSEEIAIILELSAYTVAGYLKDAMRKLEAVSRVQAIARAYRYRLL